MATGPQPAKNEIQVGKANVSHGWVYPGSYPYPPQIRVWPTQYVSYPVPVKDGYANRVEVEHREHDAVLRFYRDGKNSGQIVAEVTVPLPLLYVIAPTPVEDED